MKSVFTVDSFGSRCPENWEEIINYLNEKLEETDEDPEDIWERYCSGKYPDAPEPIIEE